MLTETQPRGSMATAPPAVWGVRSDRRRPLLLALAVAIAIHLPMLPTRAFLWIDMFFREPPPLDDGPQQEVVVPIDLDLSEPAPPPDAAPPDPPPEAPAPPPNDGRVSLDGAAEGEVDLDAALERDAGVGAVVPPPPPAAPPAPEPEAKEPGPAVPPPAPEPPAAPPLPTPEKLPAGELADPFEAAGDVGRLRAEEPNVNIYLAGDVLRTRALAQEFSALLTSVPQWQALLGGTGVDPMKHFDHVLISGPQMRDPRWIVVTVQYNLSSAQMKKAVDVAVQRTKRGSAWLDGYDVPVAVLGGPAKRFVVLVPERRLLVILPEEAEKLIPRVAELPGFSRSNQAGIVVDMIEPHKAFQAAPFEFPRSIGRMRLHFTLAGTEDYLVTAEGWDASATEASDHARYLQQRVDAFELDLGVVGRMFGAQKIRAIGDTTFEAKGAKIHARAEVSHKQLKRIVGFIQAWLDARAEEAKVEAEKAKEAREQRQREAKERREAAQQKQREARERRAKARKDREGQEAAEAGGRPPPMPAAPPAPPPEPAGSSAPAGNP